MSYLFHKIFAWILRSSIGFSSKKLQHLFILFICEVRRWSSLLWTGMWTEKVLIEKRASPPPKKKRNWEIFSSVFHCRCRKQGVTGKSKIFIWKSSKLSILSTTKYFPPRHFQEVIVLGLMTDWLTMFEWDTWGARGVPAVLLFPPESSRAPPGPRHSAPWICVLPFSRHNLGGRPVRTKEELVCVASNRCRWFR
jgi:hypothetical protein